MCRGIATWEARGLEQKVICCMFWGRGAEKMSSLLLGLLLLFILQTSESLVVLVNPEPGTTVILTSSETSNCTVCVGENPDCSVKKILSDPQKTTVRFTCPTPQNVIGVEINRVLDCTKSCTYGTIYPDGSILPDFDRVFTWDLRGSPSKYFQLDFPSPGMKQIRPSEQCPDKHTYSILMYRRTGPVPVATLCHSGPVTRLQVLLRGRLSLEVSKGTVLSPSGFNYSEANAVGTVSAVVDVVLTRGLSTTEYFSASKFPKDFEMKWNFVVPPMHNVTVAPVSQTLPECQSGEVKVTYLQGHETLTATQLTNYQGNFSLLLTNCEVMLGNGPELFLNFRVAVFRSGIPYLCTVDLQNDKGLSLQIKDKTTDSFCELSMDSVVQKTITVASGSKAVLSFLDCRSDELLLIATKTIDCQDLSSCSRPGVFLNVPVLDSCLPTPLQEVAWVVQTLQGGALELTPSQGGLSQVDPEQGCTAPTSVLVSGADGFSVGCFSSRPDKGYIDRVQVASNVLIRALAGATALSPMINPVLNVSFNPEITEDLIYTISLTSPSSVLLMTPNWPDAMKSDATVSWIVNIPDDSTAELSFLNVSKPKCRESHAAVIIKEMGSEDEQSFREDSTYDIIVQTSQSFYLNISNCEPSSGHFAILSRLSLQKKTIAGKPLPIILGVIGALLAVLLVVLTVVCVATRKKQRQQNGRSSMFIPKGIASLPGDASFPNPRANNESHVYEYIDDTMVYGHLLEEDQSREGGTGHFNGHQVRVGSEPDGHQGPGTDVYRPFLAPSDTFMPPRPRSPLGPLNSLGFEDRRMVYNELYTFKNVGDVNTIMLSDDDPLPPPDMDCDYTLPPPDMD